MARTATKGKLMDVGTALGDGWKVFVRDIGVLIVAGIIAVVLSGVTIGILGGPLYAGLVGMILGRVRDGRPPQIGDVFSRFDRFGRYLAAFYLLVISVGIGLVLLIVPGLYLAAIWLYVFPLMVDRDLTLGEALSESRKMTNAHGLGTHMLVVLVLGVVAAVVGGVLGIGLRGSSYIFSSIAQGVVLPYLFAVVVGMYARLLGYGYLVEAVGRQQR
jgi:hypothetical protein